MITKDFVLAGKAVFTLKCPAGFGEGKPHYTYRVKHKEADGTFPEAWFVSLLTGPDNTRDYTYIGMLLPHSGQVQPTKKSKYTLESMPVKLINRVLYRVWADQQQAILDAGFDLHHEGRCACCGRALTTPESILTGIGPVCAAKL